MTVSYFLGVDVGTGSVRAGLFDAAGALCGTGRHPILMWREAGDIAEQSSEDIWQAVCRSVREACATAGVDGGAIAGIGFDATCSLVVVGPGGAPLPVGDGPAERNVIVWMDHRATAEARAINATRHPVLDYVGGAVSPEMQTPKLLWLKQHRPASFAGAWQFFDLADYLGWRATGSLARSTCTVTCKWTYLAHEQRWDESYFRTIGLGALADEHFARIGTEIVEPGISLGGLGAAAAAELGLAPGTPVGAGLIDAHAGGIGTVGSGGGSGSIASRLAYVMGTSACTMASTDRPAFVPGVWGPYYSAMVPGLWLNEGGQSAAGAAIDRLVRCHPAFGEAAALAKAGGVDTVAWLAAEAGAQSETPSAAARLAGRLHVVPDFLGNRSPLADPAARAVIAGLDMDESLASLLGLYVAGICALGYGLRQIVQAQQPHGVVTQAIVISGGAGQSDLVRQLLADATGLPVAIPATDEPVLLGSAMLGAVAGGVHATLGAAMTAMSHIAHTVRPAAGFGRLHEGRYRSFLRLQQAAAELGRNDEDLT
jgi:D-ribulokinase